MKTHLPTFALLAFLALAPLAAQAAPAQPAAPVATYDLVWDSPSANARGSMPLGNGDVAANVWVEPNGDLVLLVAKSDSFDEFNRLLKLGRIRIKTVPALFQPGDAFTQALHVKDGAIDITTPTAKLRVWIDANHPALQVDCQAKQPVEAQVILENWRTENRVLGNEGPGASSTCGNQPGQHRVNADTVLPAKPGRLAWCHHNTESQWKKNLELTALGDEAAKARDPVLDRSFGALVEGDGFNAVSNTELKKTGAAFSLRVAALTTFAPSPEAWLAQAEKLAASIPADADARFAAHTAWWHTFWDRSRIEITPADPADVAGAAKAAQVSRAYALQRFVNACAGRGALPIKFNGSLFTVEGRDPDFRAWGGGYWWQNTREAYWTMPYAGDYDLMTPLFKMYMEALPLRMAATQKYYGHEGAFYPETMFFWGNYMDQNYGFNRTGKPDGLTDNAYIRRYWQGGIELVAMMQDYYDGTQDAAFRDQALLPMAKQITLFFDQHWKRGEDGKIRFDPAQSLETWHTAVNPLPEIAGLRFILPRLLALPADEATKVHWRKLLADLPPVPVATDKAGRERIMPAEKFGNKSNQENPELYGVFPYRTYTAMTGGKELELGLNAWRVRGHPVDKGWQQNVIQAPLLGLGKEAQAMVIGRAANTAGGYRFPGFFGPNYDWTPEQCHGTNLMTGLQRMLMQCEGDRIVLTPAWPKNWNASFKLHAPKNTTVEARVEDGEIKDLKVTPESRRKDVEIRPAQ